MGKDIRIEDRERKWQLSTSRICVLDVFPYLEMGYTYAQIQELMPSLSDDEIRVVEEFVAANHDEVAEENRLGRERNSKNRNPPEIEAVLSKSREERIAWMKARLKERLGANHSG